MKFYSKLFFSLTLILKLSSFTAHAAEVLSSQMQNLRAEFQSHIASQPADTFVSKNPLINVIQNQRVSLEISVKKTSQVTSVLNKLKAIGVTQLVNYKKQVSAVIAIDKLSLLNEISEISWVSSSKATRRELGPPGGLVFNAADPALFTDVVRKRFNVDGSGVTIGVLSDSYDCLAGAELDIATGDLPADVRVIKEFPFCENAASDEGRAMMQLIHDIAPGAKLLFYTAFVSATDFATGIQVLADEGADIIVDDVGYLTVPMFQEGPIAQSVNQVKQRGVTYFSAAGNSARLSYENEYVAGKDSVSRIEGHDFGKAANQTSNFYQKITIPANVFFRMSMQWDDPSEVAGGNGAETDLDLFLLDASKKRVVTSSQDDNIGHNPVEFIGGVHTFESTDFFIQISHRAGPIPKRIKYILFGPVEPYPLPDEEPSEEVTSVSIDEFNTQSGTIFGHPNAEGAIAVGAISYQQTPWFGVPIFESRIAFFSSAGGTPILFSPEGKRLAQPKLKLRPQIVAPDNTDTTFFGEDTDENGFPNFRGTSAAAPHAAALAALLKQAFPQLTADEMARAMTKGSLDLNDPVDFVGQQLPNDSQCASNTIADFGTGCGLVQADLVFEQVAQLSDEVFLTLATSVPTVTAGESFKYDFKVQNFSPANIDNVRIRGLELPKFINFLSIQGCDSIDKLEVSCLLGTVLSGETKAVSIKVMPSNNSDGKFVFRADLLTSSNPDLSNTKVNLQTFLANLAGDFNNDGCVDLGDWGILFGAIRAGGSFNVALDLNADGLIGLADLTVLESNYSRPLGDACS